METVQLVLADRSYAAALREMLLRSGGWNVVCPEAPDPALGGVLVLDGNSLERLPTPLPHPERIVLVAKNEQDHLARAWEAGVVSLVFETDPLNTAMLAIMAAGLRLAKDARRGATLPAEQGGPASRGPSAPPPLHGPATPQTQQPAVPRTGDKR